MTKAEDFRRQAEAAQRAIDASPKWMRDSAVPPNRPVFPPAHSEPSCMCGHWFEYHLAPGTECVIEGCECGMYRHFSREQPIQWALRTMRAAVARAERAEQALRALKRAVEEMTIDEHPAPFSANVRVALAAAREVVEAPRGEEHLGGAAPPPDNSTAEEG